jgi:hypothetical protein
MGLDHEGGTELAETSTMLALGTEAPAFALPDVATGRAVRRSDFDDRKDWTWPKQRTRRTLSGSDAGPV